MSYELCLMLNGTNRIVTDGMKKKGISICEFLIRNNKKGGLCFEDVAKGATEIALKRNYLEDGKKYTRASLENTINWLALRKENPLIKDNAFWWFKNGSARPKRRIMFIGNKTNFLKKIQKK